MRQCFLLILFFPCLRLFAQTNRDKLIGDWKFYLRDNINFEFLRLNGDGTGIKCSGQTINGKDSLFENHITALLITNWKIDKQNLIIQSNNNLSFNINPNYKLAILNDDKIQLEGEHLMYNLFPSWLNRKEFSRTLIYQRASTIQTGHGITTMTCISKEKIFTFKPIDANTQIVEYIGFPDLIPHLVSCNYGFEYAPKYFDPPYSIVIPTLIKHHSFGWGNKNFYISLNSEDNDSSETSIVIYYDFDDKMKSYYFSEINNGKEKKHIVRQNNLNIYKTINWQGKFEGKVFLENSLFVAYYTRNQKLEEMLQKCITSFKYK
jgi:hypothetical protein